MKECCKVLNRARSKTISCEKKLNLLYKGIKDPIKAVRYVSALIDNRFKITETAKASGKGKRLVIRDWEIAKSSGDFTALGHIQRYEWVMPYIKGLRCLDAGCGSGYGTYYIAKNGVNLAIGVDASTEAINFARKHYKAKNLAFVKMDACNLKFENNYFDAVISFDVIEHLDGKKQEAFIPELSRVLCAKGTLYIGCPNAEVRLGNNPHHFRELTKTEFESLLQKSFASVKIFGQDILKDGMRQKENWHKNIHDLSYQHLAIVEDDCAFVYGLLAVCKNKKDHKKKMNPQKKTGADFAVGIQEKWCND